MKIHSFKIKLGLFVSAMTVIVLIFGVNRIVINQLREEARQQVEHLAKIYSDAINSDNEEDIRLVMDILLPSMKFPIIITSGDEISAVLNLDISEKEGTPLYKQKTTVTMQEMDENFQPLALYWNEVQWGKIHYADPQVVNQLRWIPYFEVGFGLVFIVLTLWGFQLIRRSEKNLIYAGMARETAHQLGTPISSLMGWVKLLRESKEDHTFLIDAMDEDVARLSEISERFSKIGSQPRLNTLNILEIVQEAVDYIQHRLPKQSEISISLQGDDVLNIPGDKVLLRWAVDNLLKNAVDAISSKSGEISIISFKERDNVVLDIIDSGKGIPRKNWKNIFRPGFSSKSRGWGLGLSLTQRIVEEIHNGNIKVLRSQAGETVFRLEFPESSS
ncbi:MAG: HAMP domain-containing sensor histidine kinase [Candidatus Marinimicrobia bacterium]|nr:HAMP domain-containing sensor histidine kinase [Candidatus Neomarinimicrobiota bacterium]